MCSGLLSLSLSSGLPFSAERITDLDCKLKSATQTPAAMHNNLHNNVPEILGRTNVSNSQMYYKTVSTHFASCIIILIFKIVSDSLDSRAILLYSSCRTFCSLPVHLTAAVAVDICVVVVKRA